MTKSELIEKIVLQSAREVIMERAFREGKRISEKEIINAIKINGAKTLEDISKITSAGLACGRCKGNIENILPRKNSLIRPAVANVDQALIVFAAKERCFANGCVGRAGRDLAEKRCWCGIRIVNNE